MPSEFLLQLVKTLLIIGMAAFLIRLSRRAVYAMKRKALIPATMALLVKRLIRWVIIGVAALLILEVYDMPLKSVWAGILSVTVLVAVAFFASWSLLSNILSSVLLLTFSRIRIGDFVELRDTKSDDPGTYGRVVDINAFFVTIAEVEKDAIRGRAPATVQVPNHMFFYRITRRWPGNDTQPLIDAFENSPSLDGKKETPVPPTGAPDGTPSAGM